MSNLPNDPIMLLSVVNTNLRDYFDTLDDFCEAKEIDREALIEKLGAIDYKYDFGKNQFV